jgi:hypothetical protein
MVHPQLLTCRHCYQRVSPSALYCPACYKFDDAHTNRVITARHAVRWATLFALAAVGPNAIVGALIGPSLSRPSQKQVMDIARRTKALDSIPLGNELTVFFSTTGYTPVMLYDVKKKPELPTEISWENFTRVTIYDGTEPNETIGNIEFKTLKDVSPPHRPKAIERFLLGKDLYESMIRDADEFERNGPSEFSCHSYLYQGRHHRARAEMLAAKFEEYSTTYGPSAV